MDNRLGGSLSVQQAADVLRRQWRSGVPDIAAVAEMLNDSSTSSLIELVAIDARESLAFGKSVGVSDYLIQFPQLVGHEELLSKTLSGVRTTAGSGQLDGQTDSSESSMNMFSKASVGPTENFESKSKLEEPISRSQKVSNNTQHSLPVDIGNFHCTREIGRGSFGRVLQCTDKNLGRTVAIKIKEAADEKGLSEDFLHEARSISRLEHPNIVRLLQADETESGFGYLVYEYVDGETLDKRVQRGDYSIKDCVSWIASIAEALDYAHRRGIIHRDVSPRNIMISNDGVARLLDFGLSSMDNSFYTQDSNRILGTPNFMSPEQASGNPHWATSYSDQFSLGSVLYYALTCKFPFAGSSTFDVLERIQKAAPASPRSIRSAVPPELEAVCLRALAKEPQLRFSTGADMAAALVTSIHTPPPSITTQNARTSGVPLIAVGALLAIVGLGVTTWGIAQLSNLTQIASEPIPEVKDFDLLQQVGNTQYSLLFDEPRDPIKELPILTVTTAQLKDDWDVEVFVFNFNKSAWSPPEKVLGRETTISEHMLTVGPNVILFIAKNGGPMDRSKLPTNALHIVKSSDSTRAKSTANNCYIASNHISWPAGKELKVLRRSARPTANQLPSKDFEDLRSAWNEGGIRFAKEGLDGLAYCAFAFWVEDNLETNSP